jgi:hypothetical protein
MKKREIKTCHSSGSDVTIQANEILHEEKTTDDGMIKEFCLITKARQLDINKLMKIYFTQHIS